MKSIKSRENDTYRSLKKLQQKKYRDKTGSFLVEGENLVAEALRMERVSQLILDAGQMEKSKWSAGEEQYAGKIRTIVLDTKLFRELSGTETPQGIMAVVTKKNEGADKVLSEDGNVLVLDRLQDPGNIGAMFRTAEAAGYRAVMVLKGTADIWSAKTIRAAAGALLRMPVVRADTPSEAIEQLKAAGKKVAVTFPGEGLSLYEADLTENVALVIGNEGNGVDPEFGKQADIKINIPMKGKTESLNAAVAAGIVMYEAVRKGKQNAGENH